MVFMKDDSENFDSTNILLFLHKWQKPLIFVTSLAIIASVVFSSSFFITPKFKSTVILYPAASNAISKALLTENPSATDDILKFGEEEETEQMLQILNSNKIRDKIIAKYHLMEHYGISPTSGYKNTLLYEEYDQNITFRRTEFMAIKITVLDKDPQMAADIANDITALLDSTKNDMQQERAQKGYQIVKEKYFKLRDEVQVMEDSLKVLREYGVIDYETQAEMINQQLAIELAHGNSAAVNRLQSKLDVLAKYGGSYVSIRDALEYEKKQLSMLKAKYEEAKTDAEQVLPTKFVVNSAYKAEKKTYPIRWIIVLITTVSAFLLTIVIILIIENLSNYFPSQLEFLNNTKQKTYHKGAPELIKEPPIPPGEPAVRAQEYQVTHEKPLPYTEPEPGKPKQKEVIKQEKIKYSEKPENDELVNNQENQMEMYFKNINILKTLFKWKTHLGVIVLVSIIAAMIFSGPFFIKPKFESFAIVYPSNMAPYSEESETEQMLQFFQSKDIRDKIIQKYDLAKRYKIDPSYKYYQTAIIGVYYENVSITKTPYESVKIDVMDTDPQVACDMVNDIINFYNEKVLETHRTKYREVVEFLSKQLASKKLEIDTIESHLLVLRQQYELFDYPNQSREIARGFLRTVDGNNSSNINSKDVLRWKNNLEEKGGEFVFYNDRYYDLVEEYGLRVKEYEEAIKNLDKEITYVSVVSKPFPADKKAYPVRWVIIAIAAIASLFFSFILVMIIENYQTVSKKL